MAAQLKTSVHVPVRRWSSAVNSGGAYPGVPIMNPANVAYPLHQPRLLLA
jgi:hypothetical protein